MKKIIPILTSVLAVLTAAAFIYQTVDIYRTAEGQMYTAEIIAAHFRPIAFLPLLLIISIIIGLFLPSESKKLKITRPVDGAALPEIPAKQKLTLRAVLLIAAIVLIIAGISNGGMFDVFVKAVNICTECIGLG